MATKRVFIWLWIACVFGNCALLPYASFLRLLPVGYSDARMLGIALVQGVLLWGVICWLGYWVLRKADLQPLVGVDLWERNIIPGVAWGVVLGIVLIVLGKSVFKSSVLATMHPPMWTGFLASFYGGINEEVAMRLLLLTFFYLIFKRMFKSWFDRSGQLWAATLAVALIFAAGHYMFGLKLASMTGLETFRIFLFNGLAGVTFGWLYWRKGLWAAMTAHFVTDLLVHAIVK
jgi:membrane protease YdiL (CAAX protease family)